MFLFLSLAGKPKKPNALKTICMMLGPDFITDIIEVRICDCRILFVPLHDILFANRVEDLSPRSPACSTCGHYAYFTYDVWICTTAAIWFV